MIQNMREVGGFPTSDGRKVRSYMMFRSAQLSRAEREDLKNISAVVDLRTPREQKEAPDQTYGCRYLPMPVFDDVTAGISHEDGSENQGLPDMAYLYGRLVNECTGSLREILRTIMHHDYSTGAILWHCSEGKDRCGITTALVLEMLGVDRETIMKDYLETNRVNREKAERIRESLRETRGEAFAESVYQAYIASERYLNAAWEAMGENYFTQRLGIDAEEMEDFRKLMLEEL